MESSADSWRLYEQLKWVLDSRDNSPIFRRSKDRIWFKMRRIGIRVIYASFFELRRIKKWWEFLQKPVMSKKSWRPISRHLPSKLFVPRRSNCIMFFGLRAHCLNQSVFWKVWNDFFAATRKCRWKMLPSWLIEYLNNSKWACILSGGDIHASKEILLIY